MRNIYLLKDLSLATGYSVYTLKYYLNLGLFTEMGRSPSTNFRYFDDRAIERLKEIRGLKNKGMSIQEIKNAVGSKK